MKQSSAVILLCCGSGLDEYKIPHHRQYLDVVCNFIEPQSLKMDFALAEYLRQNGFEQVQESDKRDIFEKDYYHPFHDKIYRACVTIYYDNGYTKFNSYSIWLMTIELISDDKNRLAIFNGIAPTTFDQAFDLFELSMPTPDYLERKDI